MSRTFRVFSKEIIEVLRGRFITIPCEDKHGDELQFKQVIINMDKPDYISKIREYSTKPVLNQKLSSDQITILDIQPVELKEIRVEAKSARELVKAQKEADKQSELKKEQEHAEKKSANMKKKSLNK